MGVQKPKVNVDLVEPFLRASRCCWRPGFPLPFVQDALSFRTSLRFDTDEAGIAGPPALTQCVLKILATGTPQVGLVVLSVKHWQTFPFYSPPRAPQITSYTTLVLTVQLLSKSLFFEYIAFQASKSLHCFCSRCTFSRWHLCSCVSRSTKLCCPFSVRTVLAFHFRYHRLPLLDSTLH